MPDIQIQGHRDKCFSFGALVVGSTGGAALGYFTKIFDPKQPMDKFTIEMKSDAIKNNKYLQPLQKLQLGGNLPYRIAGQVLGSMLLYSFLECKFQGGWSRRSLFDCSFAGAITGGAFGLRGVPGGKIGAGIGAAGLALYSGLFYIFLR